MSDPLGLLSGNQSIKAESVTTPDPLGLMDNKRLSWTQGKPEEPGILERILPKPVYEFGRDLLTDNKAHSAKAANAVTIAESTGLSPRLVYDNMDDVTEKLGVREQPSTRQHTERLLMAPVAAGLMTHPVGTLLGLSVFAGLSEAENFAVSKWKNDPYQFGAGKGLADLLPDEASQTVKDLFWFADMIAKGIATGGAIKGSKAAYDKFGERFMRETVETYNMPRTVFISPEKIREFHGMGRENIISPEETAILKDLNLSRQDYVEGLKNGIDIEIPVEKLVTIQDKPWVKGLKEFFKVSPYQETTVETAGKPGAKRPVSGLLEEGGANQAGKGGSVEASASERLLPSKSASTNEPNGTGDQVPSLSTKVQPPPLESSTAANMNPSLPTANIEAIKQPPLLENIATVDAKINGYVAMAEKDLPGLKEALSQIATPMGGEVDLMVKDKDHVADKLTRGSYVGKGPEDVPDYLGSRIIVPDPEGELNSIIEGLKGHGYEVLGASSREPNAWGYTAVHLDVKTPSGMIAEVQVHSPETVAVIGKSHKIYEKWRSQDKSEFSAEQLNEYNKDREASRSLWEAAERAYRARKNADPDDVNILLELAATTDKATAPITETSTYEAIRAESSRLAFDKIQKKVDFAKRRQEAMIQRQAREDARLDPVFMAMEDITKSGGFNKAGLEADYDKDTIKELMRKRPGIVTNDGKVFLDDAAAQHGFNDGDSLMNAMLDWQGLEVMAEKARQGFEGRYGELLTAAELEDFHIKVLEEEARILGKMLKGNEPRPMKDIKKKIREATQATRVEELTISEYDALSAAMKKAEQAAREAFRAGNKEGALKEKERQIELAEARKAKLEAKQEAAKIKDGLIKIQKDKSLPPDYQDQIAALLEDFDLMPRSARTARRVESAREFLERKEAEGESVDIPLSMLNKIERYGKTHWRDLTIAELRDIYDQAKMLQHLGKLKDKLLTAKEGRDYEKAVLGVVNTIKENWGVSTPSAEELESIYLEKSVWEKIKGGKTAYLESLIKPEFIFRRLDRWQDLGPAWRTFYEPIQNAQNAEYEGLNEIVEKCKTLFNSLDKKNLGKKVKIDGIPQILTKENMLMVALNSGNEGNLDALRKGNGWDDQQINAIISKLSPEEMAFVRGVWRLFEDQYPKLAQVYENLSGARLGKVDGDYFPLVFDRKLSWIADKNAAEAELKDFFRTIYTKPAAKTGTVIERKGGTLPVDLKFQVIFDKLAEVNHYIAFAEAVRDVQKMLSDNRVRAAIEGAPEGIGGTETYHQLMPWLQEVAKPKIDPISGVEKILKTIRANTTTVALAWKFSTAAFQWLGATNSIEKLGLGEFVKGVADFYANREAMVEQAKSMSPELAARADTWDRELRDAYGKLGIEHFKGSQVVKDSFFSLITLMDLAVSYPTWVAAFNKGMKDFNGNQYDAIHYADMTLRITQGTSTPKDFADIQRGSELKKWVAMFYTFFSAFHNMMVEAGKKFKFSDRDLGDYADLVRAWWWLTIVPATIGYMMEEREVPGPGQFLKNVIKYRLGGYPVVRDLMGTALTDYDYQFSPVARAGQVASKAVDQAMNLTPLSDDEFESDKFLRYGIESAGYAIGLPTGQAIITIKGLMDLMNGDTSDPTRLLLRAPRHSEDAVIKFDMED